MSKKISTIFLSLFLIGILSVSCSNADKTGAGETTKGIEQYNGNTYVSTEAFNYQSSQLYLWVSIKDGKLATFPDNNNTTPPIFPETVYMNITGSGTDYTFSADYYGQPNGIEGTLKFSDTSVTVKYTKNPEFPSDLLNRDIVCNIKNNQLY